MNKAILVVREYDRFSELLSENGFEVINFAAIKTAPLEDLSEFHTKLETIENYDGIFFTSPKAAEIFLNEFDEKVYCGKIYVLGNRTRTLFENRDFQVIFRNEANTAEEFINFFDRAEFADKNLLFLRGNKSLRIIPELLKDVATVDEIVAYRTLENSIDENSANQISEKIAAGEIFWVCFFSPSGIESFIEKFGDKATSDLKIAAIGATTAKKAVEKNLRTDFISPRANAEDFAVALINHIKNID